MHWSAHYNLNEIPLRSPHLLRLFDESLFTLPKNHFYTLQTLFPFHGTFKCMHFLLEESFQALDIVASSMGIKLMQYIDSLHPKWNISSLYLFHLDDHGLQLIKTPKCSICENVNNVKKFNILDSRSQILISELPQNICKGFLSLLMVSQSGSVCSTILGKAADLTLVQKTPLCHWHPPQWS